MHTNKKCGLRHSWPNLLQTNNVLTDVSSCIDRMASAISFAIDSDLIFDDCRASSDSGIEFVKTTSVSAEASMRSTAGPDRTAWVAHADTPIAPFLSRASATFHQRAGGVDQIVHNQAVPALDFTDNVITSATFGSSRRLSMMAKGTSSRLAKARARSTPPASGDTTLVRRDRAAEVLDHHRRWQTDGPPEYRRSPESAAACKSSASTRFAPAVSSKAAISFAEIGTRGRSLRSCRAYP